jgi:hypothetical protein
MSESNKFKLNNKEMGTLGTFETVASAVEKYPNPMQKENHTEADGLCIGEEAYYKRSGFEAPSKYSLESGWMKHVQEALQEVFLEATRDGTIDNSAKNAMMHEFAKLRDVEGGPTIGEKVQFDVDGVVIFDGQEDVKSPKDSDVQYSPYASSLNSETAISLDDVRRDVDSQLVIPFGPDEQIYGNFEGAAFCTHPDDPERHWFGVLVGEPCYVTDTDQIIPDEFGDNKKVFVPLLDSMSDVGANQFGLAA